MFRNRERGALHAPEFTLVEWYRSGEPYTALMADCAALLREAAQAAGTWHFSFRGRSADPAAEPERLSVAEAFGRFASIDLLATLDGGEGDRDGLAHAAHAAGIRIADDDTWGDIFSRVLVEKIEPKLGIGRATILDEYPALQAALARPSPHDPRVADDDTWGDIFSRVLVEKIEPKLGIGRATILDEYPAQQAALARPSPHDARVAERFELYVCGVELANGFAELTDAREQRSRLEREMAEKQRRYSERYPLDEDFLAALAHMPDACGIALGLDRLVMLATGASRIDQVLWAPPADS